ncbi:MAG: hypothetical protein U0795_18215 [Pirellulales bacterium]
MPAHNAQRHHSPHPSSHRSSARPHRRLFARFLLALCLLGSRQALSQTPPTPPAAESAAKSTEDAAQKDKIAALFRQLEAPGQAAREAAEKELVNLGPDVLNHLPAITATTSAELKLRVARIQSELQKQFAASLAKGSTVSLNGRMKLSAALESLQQQTGNQIIDYRSQFGQSTDDPEIEVKFENVSYLQGLDQVFDAAQLDVYNFAGEVRKLAMTGRAEDRLPRSKLASYDGLFRFEPVSVGAERDLRNPKNRGLRLTMEVLWEPKVLPLVISQPLSELHIEDPDGQDLPLEQTEGSIDIPVQSTVAGVTIDLPIDLPARTVPRIGRLRGQGRALVPGMMAKFQFGQLSKSAGTRQQQAGISVTLESVRKNEEAYEIRVKLALENANPSLQSYLDWAANNVAYLENSAGQRIGEPSFEKYLENENQVGYAYFFPADAELDDYQLIYETPSMILDVPFSFDLRDIDLP